MRIAFLLVALLGGAVTVNEVSNGNLRDGANSAGIVAISVITYDSRQRIVRLESEYFRKGKSK